jgi:hypothetical protein
LLTFTAALILPRIPAEWVYVVLAQAPDSLATALWIALGGLVTTIVALATYIRSLLAEIRQMDKEHHAQLLLLTERVLTAGIEMKEAVKDNTAAIESLAGESKRRRNATGKGANRGTA